MNSEAIAKVTEAALDTLESLAGVSHDKAAAALAAVKAVVQALRGARAGHVSPQEALTQIETLHGQIADNDTAALDELGRRQ